MAESSRNLARTFPQAVHDSLAELRRMALDAKGPQDVRRATPEEIALAETQRKPHHCVGHSSRTGLPCRQSRVHGMTVCRKHGGSLKRVRAKAALRLAGAVDPVLGRMIDIATQRENLQAAVKAGVDVLDRAGVGALVQAKVRSSRQTDRDGRITVNIGFLAEPDGRATTIDLPAVKRDGDDT